MSELAAGPLPEQLELPSAPFRAVKVTPSDGPAYWSVAGEDDVTHRSVDDYLSSLRTDRPPFRRASSLQQARSLACFLNWAHSGGHDLEGAARELPDLSRRLSESLRRAPVGDGWRPGSPERVESALATVCDYYAYLVEHGLVQPHVLGHARQVRDMPDAGVRSYAQNGEDLQIAYHLGRRGATYIDVGCLWPKHFSNSYFFYRYGGFGLCIDPNPTIAEDFRRERPRDIFLNCGVAASPGTMTYYMHNSPVFNTFSSEHAAELAERVAAIEDSPQRTARTLSATVEVPVMTLDEAVLSTGFAALCDGWVDFLSIDVEGLELQVLSGFSFQELRPRLVVVEDFRRGSEVRLPAEELQVVVTLREHGYSLAGFSGVNLYLLDDAPRSSIGANARSGASIAAAGAIVRENAITRENAHPGTRDWWGKHAPPHAIEGYSAQCSVRPGDTLELHVSTRPAARYRIAVYRLGWYEGRGARAMVGYPSAGDLQGIAREVPDPQPGPHIDTAGWPVTDVISIGEDWTTGVYLARLILTSGEHAGLDAMVSFVVRPALESVAADVLVQQPVTTAHAYNSWGGKSLYTSNSTDDEAAVKVTFDRPYPAWGAANPNARWPFAWDYQLLRFLEREGFDVAYTTDVDTHREPWSLAGHRLLMTSGHDEYWTREMRDAFDAALAEGVNLACMGANTAYWQVRFEDSERTMVEYRWRAADPEPDRALKTEMFRNLEPPRPECLLWGVQYQEGLARSALPPRDYQLVPECLGHPWMQDTGFAHPATLAGLVGYEWDAIQAGLEPPGGTVFFHYDNELSNADAVAYRASSGSVVFAAGSLQFSWGLDDWDHAGHADERLQRFMGKALADLSARRADAEPETTAKTVAGGGEASL